MPALHKLPIKSVRMVHYKDNHRKQEDAKRIKEQYLEGDVSKVKRKRARKHTIIIFVDQRDPLFH